MTLYVIMAVRGTSEPSPDGRGFSGAVHLPLFLLDSEIQGIVSPEHACRVALDILGEGHSVSAHARDDMLVSAHVPAAPTRGPLSRRPL